MQKGSVEEEVRYYYLLPREHDGESWTEVRLREITQCANLKVAGCNDTQRPDFINSIVMRLRATAGAPTHLLCLGPISDTNVVLVDCVLPGRIGPYALTAACEQSITEAVLELRRLETLMLDCANVLKRSDDRAKRAMMYVRQMAADWPVLDGDFQDITAKLDNARWQEQDAIQRRLLPHFVEFREQILGMAPAVMNAVRKDDWLNGFSLSEIEASLARILLPGSVAYLYP